MEQTDYTFAEMIIERGIASREQVDECLWIVRKALDLGAAGTNLLDTMVSKGYVSREQADALLAEIQRGESKVKVIGGYELLSKVGGGGMAVVYKARKPPMDRVVAFKVLRPALSRDEMFVQRFFREAHSVAMLNHPNIVQAFDAGYDQGYHYFVMEFVDGTTVRTLIKRNGQIEERRALHITDAVAAALEHAHEHGVVHRDIKPDNIMITRDGVVKLADLGLARSTVKPDTITIDGTTLGTPYYMAPEQVRGEPDVDTRADIYSLGATLYHMVTGEYPFDGPTAAAVMTKHITEPVPNPKDKNPDLSWGARHLIQRMMAKDRGERPQTPAELRREIEDLLAGRVKLSPRPAAMPLPVAEFSQEPGPSAPARKRLRIALAIGAAALLVAASVGLFLAFRGHPELPPEPEPLPEVQVADVPEPGAEPATPKPAPPSVTDEQLQGQLGELTRACATYFAKEQFAYALRAIDAFTKAHPNQARDAITKLRDEVTARAEQRYRVIFREADVALEQRDFAKARQLLRQAEAMGVPELADRVQRKLWQVDLRERNPGIWGRWDDIRGRARGLAAAGQYDEAIRLLTTARDLPLRGIAELVAQEIEAVEELRRQAGHDLALVYTKDSDKLWALFKERKYAEADKLLAQVAAKPGADQIGGRFKADAQAAKLLREFWAAVEAGVAARKGKPVSIAGISGTLTEIKNGEITVEAENAQIKRRLDQIAAKQAVAYADPKGDALPKLTKGVFYLAEEMLDDAERALAGAAPAPYKARLDALKAARLEADAPRAWQDLLPQTKGELTRKRARELLAALDKFGQTYASTKYIKAVAPETAATRAHLEEAADGWARLFDGKSLAGWKILSDGSFAKHGNVDVSDARILLPAGDRATGIVLTRDFPKTDYEVALDVMPAQNVRGGNVGCMIGFPVAESRCCLGLGWGHGQIVGLDRVDARPAGNNATTSRAVTFNQGFWYHVLLRVTKAKIEVYIDQAKLVDVPTAQHTFTVAAPWTDLQRFGVGTWDSAWALREIKYRRLEPGDDPKPAK